MPIERFEAMTSSLRRSNLRLTPQRLAICRYLATAQTHPAPNEVYEHVRGQYPTMSLATVYNTLSVLRDLGEIIEIPGVSGGVRYETVLQPHVNLICLRCGEITDLPLESLSDLPEAIQTEADFELRGLRIDGFGLCTACQAIMKQKGTENA